MTVGHFSLFTFLICLATYRISTTSILISFVDSWRRGGGEDEEKKNTKMRLVLVVKKMVKRLERASVLRQQWLLWLGWETSDVHTQYDKYLCGVKVLTSIYTICLFPLFVPSSFIVFRSLSHCLCHSTNLIFNLSHFFCCENAFWVHICIKYGIIIIFVISTFIVYTFLSSIQN